MKRKKKILLNWWYDREDLLLPFLNLKDEIDFVLLFYKRPSEKEPDLPFSIIYWDDYATPFTLLKSVSPDEVVFINIDDAPYQIALNLACRKVKIPTTICDHAMRGYADLPAEKINFKENKLTTARFLFSALSFTNIKDLPKLLLLVYYKLRNSPLGRTGSGLQSLRIPDKYICFSRSSAEFFIARDKASNAQITLIGNPSFDPFFDQKPCTAADDFYLLIDQPFVKSKFGNDLVTLKEKNRFLEKLGNFCAAHNKRLVVKLHPDNFGQNYFLRHPAIEYQERGDIVSLIHHCSGVFGFYSTLLIPAIYFKKCIAFKINELEIQKTWAEMGVVNLLDFYSFSESDIDFETFTVPEESLKYFTDYFIYKPDGRAQQRLKIALQSPGKICKTQDA